MMTFIDMLSIGGPLQSDLDMLYEEAESTIVYLDGDFNYHSGDVRIWINIQIDDTPTIIVPDLEYNDPTRIRMRRSFYIYGPDGVADDFAFASIQGRTDKDTIHRIMQRLTDAPSLTYDEKIELVTAIKMEAL